MALQVRPESTQPASFQGFHQIRQSDRASIQQIPLGPAVLIPHSEAGSTAAISPVIADRNKALRKEGRPSTETSAPSRSPGSSVPWAGGPSRDRLSGTPGPDSCRRPWNCCGRRCQRPRCAISTAAASRSATNTPTSTPLRSPGRSSRRSRDRTDARPGLRHRSATASCPLGLIAPYCS